tara:strand:+ start:1728 stop:2339 length:612 start_codon:yes stop_codon:yes gene_type:complete
MDNTLIKQKQTFNTKIGSQKEINIEIGAKNEIRMKHYLNSIYNNKFKRMKKKNDNNSNSIDFINHRHKIIAEIKSVSYKYTANYPRNKNRYDEYGFWISQSKINKYDNKYSIKYPGYDFHIYYLFADGLYNVIYNKLSKRDQILIKNTKIQDSDNTNPNVPNKANNVYVIPKRCFDIIDLDMKSNFPIKDNRDIISNIDECLL